MKAQTLEEITEELRQRQEAAAVQPTEAVIKKGPNSEVLARILIRVAEWQAEQEAKKLESA